MRRVVPGVLIGLLGLLAVGAAAFALTASPGGTAVLRVAPASHGTAGMGATACEELRQGRPVALTSRGAVAAFDPRGASVTRVLATGARPHGGVALDRRAGRLYLTARGPDGVPAVWSIGCKRPVTLAVRDAELPAVSPGGGSLAYVVVDRKGQQAGVDVVALGPSGVPMAPANVLRATSVPPPNPIRELALGPGASVLAVWGGFVDPVLGPDRQTTGTLDPKTASSLRALRPVITLAGISIPAGVGRPPTAWQTAAVYLPNGELVVGLDGRYLTMPFSTAHGGGFRDVVGDAGRVVSVGVGPAGGILWVTTGGRLELRGQAWNVPFGPQAMTPPSTPPPARIVRGRFTAVAWTAGNGAVATTHPPQFSIVRLPSVVGMREPQAAHALDRLDLPSDVAHTVIDPTVPPGTVVAQDPAAGAVEACQCSVNLTVSSGGAPATASRP